VPEVLARTDHDFVLSQERRPRRASRAKRKPARAAWIRAMFRNPGATAVGAAGAAVAVGIVINALAFQNAPHPAPMFGRPLGETVKLSGIPTVLPPSRPADLSAATPASPASPAETPRDAARAQKASLTPASSSQPSGPARDAIGDILKTGSTVSEPSRAVLSAQKALNKLGYGPVKTDGVFGSGTRQAIEKFERDRKLPPTGEVSGRTARELAAAAGPLAE
jgi:hypothetical protein